MVPGEAEGRIVPRFGRGPLDLPPRRLPQLELAPAAATLEVTEPGLGDPLSEPTELKDALGRTWGYGQRHVNGAWIEVTNVARYTWRRGGPVRSQPDAGQAATKVQDVFHRGVLPLLLQVEGLACLHASAVAAGGGVVAFAGKSGIGKSTLAAALARRGWLQWADDSVALEVRAGSCVAVGIPFLSRIDAEGASLVEGLEPGTETSRPFAGERRRLAAVLLLARADEATPLLTRLPQGKAVAGLLANAFSFALEDAGDRRRLAETYMELAATVAVLRMVLPRRPEHFPASVDFVAAEVCKLGADPS